MNVHVYYKCLVLEDIETAGGKYLASADRVRMNEIRAEIEETTEKNEEEEKKSDEGTIRKRVQNLISYLTRVAG